MAFKVAVVFAALNSWPGSSIILRSRTNPEASELQTDNGFWPFSSDSSEESAVEEGLCHVNCYTGQHATIAWKVSDQTAKSRCQWTRCSACKECQENSVEKVEDDASEKNAHKGSTGTHEKASELRTDDSSEEYDVEEEKHLLHRLGTHKAEVEEKKAATKSEKVAAEEKEAANKAEKVAAEKVAAEERARLGRLLTAEEEKSAKKAEWIGTHKAEIEEKKAAKKSEKVAAEEKEAANKAEKVAAEKAAAEERARLGRLLAAEEEKSAKKAEKITTEEVYLCHVSCYNEQHATVAWKVFQWRSDDSSRQKSQEAKSRCQWRRCGGCKECQEAVADEEHGKTEKKEHKGKQDKHHKSSQLQTEEKFWPFTSSSEEAVADEKHGKTEKKEHKGKQDKHHKSSQLQTEEKFWPFTSSSEEAVAEEKHGKTRKNQHKGKQDAHAASDVIGFPLSPQMGV